MYRKRNVAATADAKVPVYVNMKKMQVVFDAEKGIDILRAPSESPLPPDSFPPLLTQMYGRIMRRFELHRQPVKILYSLDDMSSILRCVPQVVRCANSPAYEPSHTKELVLLYSQTGRCLAKVPQQLVHHTGSIGSFNMEDRDSFTVVEEGVSVWNTASGFGGLLWGVVYLFFLFEELIEFSLFVNPDGSPISLRKEGVP